MLAASLTSFAIDGSTEGVQWTGWWMLAAYGLATLCVGVGRGQAALFER
jgi:hypothetical protein